MSAELNNGQLAAIAGWPVVALVYIGVLTCGWCCAHLVFWLLEDAGPRLYDRLRAAAQPPGRAA